MQKKLVLVGAGRAHLHLINAINHQSFDDIDITLVSPSPYFYNTDMFPGYTEEIYTLDDIRINVKDLAKRANISFIEGAALSLDPLQKQLMTSTGDMIDFDVISFNIGALSQGSELPGVLTHAHLARPSYQFPDSIEYMRANGDIAIVGGTQKALELAFAIKSWRFKQQMSGDVHLLTENHPAASFPSLTNKTIERLLKTKEISYSENTFINTVEQNKVIDNKNHEFSYDHLFWLTQPKAFDIFTTSGLPTDQDGFLHVEETLQVKKYPFIFGAGKHVSINGYPNRKIGDHDINHGPILLENIKGFLNDGDGILYQPNKHPVHFLSIGNEYGYLSYGHLSLKGKWAWKVQNYLNRRTMAKYKD